ncbi:MAG: glycosyltransferase [Candidatus Gastranaerophilales bacterium]|nr:glycosyltransferase [Candidatus Gastranaerophilales bacterium]
MKILFLHRNFPAQFRHVAFELAKNPLNLILFITCNDSMNLRGINKLVYTPRPVSKGCNNFLYLYEDNVNHGQDAATLALALKQRGIIPDVIYGHSWGQNMFMKDIFPDVPLICYFEWFGKTKGADLDFDGRLIDENYEARIRFNNSSLLLDLDSCDVGVSPTNWQRSQFPKEFQDKIKVVPDGVNTEICKPDPNAKFIIADKNLELTTKDEVITYATRGMEPYRGFPQFMEAAEKILKKRPNAHVVIAGQDAVFYGQPLPKGTFKELMLDKLDLDMNRVHFVGSLAFHDYVSLLQISSAHVYLTYPFVMSWSALDAMAIGCCIVASNNYPVLEFIKDGYNGLLADFYDIDGIVDKIEYALDNRDKMQEIRKNAVKTIVENYDFKDTLPKHIQFIESMIKK